MNNEDLAKMIISQFMPCICHIDHAKCENPECVEYGLALDYVDDDMMPERAIQAIIANTNISYDNAKRHVDSMVDIGHLQTGKRPRYSV